MDWCRWYAQFTVCVPFLVHLQVSLSSNQDEQRGMILILSISSGENKNWSKEMFQSIWLLSISWETVACSPKRNIGDEILLFGPFGSLGSFQILTFLPLSIHHIRLASNIRLPNSKLLHTSNGLYPSLASIKFEARKYSYLKTWLIREVGSWRIFQHCLERKARLKLSKHLKTRPPDFYSFPFYPNLSSVFLIDPYWNPNKIYWSVN